MFVPDVKRIPLVGKPCANLAHSSHAAQSHNGSCDDLISCRSSQSFPVSTLMADSEKESL